MHKVAIHAKVTPHLASGLICLGLGTVLVGCGDQGSPGIGGQAPAGAEIVHVADPVNHGAPAGGDAAEPAINFSRDIRPILSDRCFACHGPDAASSDKLGGFRLDSFESATAVADSGVAPIVPGDPAASEVVRRINASDRPNIQMPPPDSHLKLTPAEIDLLTRWIAEGAEYTGHWAYQSPVKPELPAIEHGDWAKNAIDYFVAAKMEQAGLSPSDPASRATLIRRVSLDLTGLPPTPQEIDAFVNDASADAYEKVVDRLLGSPHYGERVAMVWLDAARYADTNGFHHDNIRTSWPWRQWVIGAFNDNMPYDQFIIEQLAGDLLPDPTQEQILASGFCRMHNINDEGGALDAEYRVEAVADRIETISTVFLAQTMTCSRCHDHKYDPISQDDYYSLYAYFNSVQERGVFPNNAEQARAYPARMMYTTPEQDAALEQKQIELAQAVAERESQTAAVAQEQQQWEHALRQRLGIEWAALTLASVTSTHPGTTLTPQADGSVLLGGEVPGRESITYTLRTDATGLRLIQLDALPDPSMKDRIGRAPNGNAVLSQITVQAVSVADPTQSQAVTLTDAWADFIQPNGDFDVQNALREDKLGWAVGGHLDPRPRTAMFLADQPFGYEGGTELRVTLHYHSPYGQHTLGRVRVTAAAANTGVGEVFATVMSDWFEVGPFPAASYQAAYDQAFGPESATDIRPGADVDGGQAVAGMRWAHRPNFMDGQDNALAGENRAFYLGRSIFTPTQRQLKLDLGSDDGIRVYLNGEEVFANNIQRGLAQGHDATTITLVPGQNTLVLKIINGGGVGGFFFDSEPVGASPNALAPFALIPPDRRSGPVNTRFSDDWRDRNSPTYRALSEKVTAIEKDMQAIREMAVPVLIMKELDQPVPMHILDRGAYDGADMDRPVTRHPPASMGNPELPEGAPNNRLGFAQWLTQPDHPLTARVHVNRFWQMIFGTGIVATSEDFGSQADWPSHPELLDYLAVDFVESGWDQKALVKEIVMSATYRQRAVARTEAMEIDPANRLLSYFPRRRLPGEMIRDQALFVAGLMNDAIGGDSVRPYQPEGLWREVSIGGGGTNTGNFKRDDGDALYRRSMYTFWKKTSPPPQMSMFNAPTREFCVVRRDVTNTPLQALVLWNDEQFLEAARALAQRTLAQTDDADTGLSLIYQRCTGKAPSDRALAVLRETLAHFQERYAAAPDDAAALLTQGQHPLPEQYDAAELAAWMMVSSAVLSLDETIVRD